MAMSAEDLDDGNFWGAESGIADGDADAIIREKEAELVTHALKGEISKARHLLEVESLPIDSVDQDGTSVLAAACFGDDAIARAPAAMADFIQYLLDEGAETSFANQHGWTPFISACYTANPIPVALLLGHVAPDVVLRRVGPSAKAILNSDASPSAVMFAACDAEDGWNGIQHLAQHLTRLFEDQQGGFQYPSQADAMGEAERQAIENGESWGDEERDAFRVDLPQGLPGEQTVAEMLVKAKAAAEIAGAAVGLTFEQLMADPLSASQLQVRPVKDWIGYVSGPARAILVKKAGLPERLIKVQNDDPVASPKRKSTSAGAGGASSPLVIPKSATKDRGSVARFNRRLTTSTEFFSAKKGANPNGQSRLNLLGESRVGGMDLGASTLRRSMGPGGAPSLQSPPAARRRTTAGGAEAGASKPQAATTASAGPPTAASGASGPQTPPGRRSSVRARELVRGLGPRSPGEKLWALVPLAYILVLVLWKYYGWTW